MWWRRFLTNPFLFSPEDNILVRRSASLSALLIYSVLNSSLQTILLRVGKQYYDIYYYYVESVIEVFFNTDWLSTSIKTGPSHEIPIILILYLKLFRYSQHCFISVNSDPNVILSILVCLFENQKTRAYLRYTKKPILEILVTVSEACSASTFNLTTKLSPLGSGKWEEVLPFPLSVQIHLRLSPSFGN